MWTPPLGPQQLIKSLYEVIKLDTINMNSHEVD